MTEVPAEAASRRPSPPRLAFRLALVLSLGAGAILLAAGAWNLASQRRQLTRLVEGQATTVIEMIRGATHDSMLRNDSAELSRLVTGLASREEVDRIRVFDKQGRINYSSEPVEIGRRVDLDAEQCIACHAADKPLSSPEGERRTRIFERPGEGRFLALVAPVRNEPACSTAACHAHSPTQTVLGVLDVQLPLTRVDAALRDSQWQLATGLVGTVAAVVALAILLAWGLVLRPVGALTAAAPRLAAGDFSARVPERSSDEIGDLERAWNRMAGELGTVHAELEAWNLKLEERVAEKTRELEATHLHLLRAETMTSLGKLAASVAHELNNPLAGIATYARLLRRRRTEAAAAGTPVTPGEDNERILKLVEDEALRCGNIVRNLLLFSRTPGARFAANDLAPIAERCALLVRHRAELAGVMLAVEIPPSVPAVECDASQIQQALLALIINAVEATPESGRVRVAASADAAAGKVIVVVEDSGRGIPPEVLPHIFEPFFTTKQEGVGVGLGLAIVYGIVVRHHGRIDATSKPGAGARFTIELPLRQPPASGDPPETEDRRSA
jgi:two-component system NtrC family sensor kinase